MPVIQIISQFQCSGTLTVAVEALTYYAGLTEKLCQILISKGISSSINTRGSLREALVKPKDKLEKEQQVGIVYHIPCAGANEQPCPGRYVGETERTANARFQEHTSTATNALGKFKSAMLQHAREHGHHFRKEDMTILSAEADWAKRGIKEAIYIRSLKPSINIDPGRHSLSSHFDQIINKEIAAPTPPEPHNENEPLINTAPRRQGRPKKQATTTCSQPVQSSPPAAAPSPPLSQPSLPQRQSQRLIQRRNQQPNAS